MIELVQLCLSPAAGCLPVGRTSKTSLLWIRFVSVHTGRVYPPALACQVPYPRRLLPAPVGTQDRYKIRKAFVAKPGCKLIVADYGQLELRLLAHMVCVNSALVCWCSASVLTTGSSPARAPSRSSLLYLSASLSMCRCLVHTHTPPADKV